MNRQIKTNLFKQSTPQETPSQTQLSTKDWKNIHTRLNHNQQQLETCQETMNSMYSKLMNYFSRMTKKIDEATQNKQKLEAETQKLIQKMEKKLSNWYQPEQRAEEQRHITSLMHRHNQFIQSYEKNLEALKKAVSRNEYQISELISEIRNFRLELDLMKRKHQTTSTMHNPSLSEKIFNRDHELSDLPDIPDVSNSSSSSVL